MALTEKLLKIAVCGLFMLEIRIYVDSWLVIFNGAFVH